MNTQLCDMTATQNEPGFVEKHEGLLTGLVLATNLVMWASAFVLIPVGLTSFSPEHLASFRQISSAAVVLPVILLIRRRQAWAALRQDWKLLAATGFLGMSFYQIALSTAQQTVNVGTASLLVSLSPVLTAILAAVILREHMSRRRIAGTSVAFIGAVGLSLGSGSAFQLEPAALLVLAAALAQAAYFLLQRQVMARHSATVVAACTIGFGCAGLLPFAGGLPQAIDNASFEATSSVLYLGIVAGVVPIIGWAWVLKRMSAAKASLWLFTSPPLAMLMAWVFLGEVPSFALLTFGALALVGVAIAQTENLNLRQTRSTT